MLRKQLPPLSWRHSRLLPALNMRRRLLRRRCGAMFRPRLVTGDPNIQPVATWVYVKGKHGNRYKRRSGRDMATSYGGYWYAKPWWKATDPWSGCIRPNKYGPSLQG